MLGILLTENLYAACGGTQRIWQGTSTTWTTTANWSGANVPDSASEDVIIRSTGFTARPTVGTNYTVGCIDIQSGLLAEATTGAKTLLLTVTGDYFKSSFANTLSLATNASTITMAGTLPQYIDVMDDLRSVTITNTSSVTFKNESRIRGTVTLPTGAGTTYIEGTVRLSANLVVPTGHTLIIKNGGALYAANLSISGTVIVEGGGELRFNGATLTVLTGGVLKALGSAGNAAHILPRDIGGAYDIIINNGGKFYSNYAVISYADQSALGIQVNGRIEQLQNTDFLGVNTVAMTLGATAVFTSTTLDSLGFYKDPLFATPKNINATSYAGANLTLTNYAGDIAGGAKSIPALTPKLIWSTPAPTAILVTDVDDGTHYTSPLAANQVGGFGSFAFQLNQAATATNITSLTFTMTGTAVMSDFSTVKLYKDGAGGQACIFDGPSTAAGALPLVDTLVGTLSFSGSPPKATFTNAGGIISANSTGQTCLHLIATTSASPSNDKTVIFSIASDADVTNSLAYPISAIAGTPVTSRYSMLSGVADSVWDGGTAGTPTTAAIWSLANNWTPNTLPTSILNCQVGTGLRTAQAAAAMNCANAYLTSGGTLDFVNALTGTLNVYAGLFVSSGFNFVNAGTANLAMMGAAAQTLSLGTTFPGNVIINNSTNSNVDVGANSTINGNLTCTKGVLNITNGFTLTVLGNITVNTGCTINVASGGTLKLGNNSTLTVNTGGTLQIIGSAAIPASVGSDSSTSAYNVIINNGGTIKAQYYVFDHLNTTGVSIEATATIDPTYHLQNGVFSYPVNSNSTMLYLKTQVPGNSINNLAFETNGSPATTIKNINTTGVAAGTLSIVGYSGDLGGVANEVAPVYLLAWSGQVNSIKITQAATSPITVTQNNTFNMGSFGFQQTLASASFVDTNLTTLKVYLTGTGSATDVSAVSLYADPNCDGSGATQLGSTGTFSGNPSKIIFTIPSGNFVIPAVPTGTPPTVCTYVKYAIAGTAVNGSTLGAKITASTDQVNSATYFISGTTFPVTLGNPSTVDVPTITTWTGATNTTWSTAGNWSAGVPTTTMTCVIPNVTNAPTITANAVCKSIDIQGEILTINTGVGLTIYGDLTNTGSIVFNGTATLTIGDYGGNTHTINSTSALAKLNLTANGLVYINNSSTTITALGTMTSGSILTIASGKKLILPASYTLSTGTIRVEGGGTLELGNATTFTVAGGIFQVAGTDEIIAVSPANAQTLATKGVITVTGLGTNNYNFTSTSGSIDLTGFQFDRLGVNGLVIGGTTVLTNLKGGQFTNLSTTYASMKAIQINTSGTIPANASNILWTWGDFNNRSAVANTPTSAQGYKLVSSTGCASHAIGFSGWDGDWYSSQPNFDVSTKVSAVTCTITMNNSSSAISLLSFTAVAHNAAVDVRWETNVERTHLGFNVYRTTDTSSRFVQINSELIRNIKSPGSNRGSYRFIDTGVSNDQNYYYYLEDIDVYGKATMHGPVFAAPFAFLDNPPADGISENSTTNSNTPVLNGTPSTIANPSYQDLGNGIVILSQTSTSLRIEITPATPVFTATAWDPSYEDVAITGYSKMTTAGKPALPEKDILIEVQRFATTAAVNNTQITASNLAGHLIAPVASYAINSSGILTPSYFQDNITYSTNAYYPAQTYPTEFYGIESNLITINDKKYLKLKINPLRFNSVSGIVKSASKIILDIGLDGDDWNVTAPEVNSLLVPYAVANTLNIEHGIAGFYQIDYNDFINSHVETPFANTDTSEWRLYFENNELPLEVHSATGIFSPGDYIRYYAPFNKQTESNKNQLNLSPINITNSTNSPKRINLLDVNPNLKRHSTEVLQTFTKTIEENLIYLDEFSLSDSLDHYFYKMLYSGFPVYDTLTVTSTLPEIDVTNPINVIVKYYVRGNLGLSELPIKHHAIFSLGGVDKGEAIFEENTRQVLTFEVSASDFIQGLNTLALRLPGTYAAGDADRVLVDKIEIVYKGYEASSSGYVAFSVPDKFQVYNIDRFASNVISAYDITDNLAPKKMYNLGIALDASNITYAAEFYIDGNTNSSNEKQYVFFEGNNFYKPTTLSLNQGTVTSLKNSSNRADLIIYGDENLIAAAADLISMREAQGLEVKTITPTEVYSEFSYGVVKSNALRDLIMTALTNWNKPPKYLLILGDGTIDPLDYNVQALASGERSALEKETLPAPMLPGSFIDFSSDNFFVSTNDSHLPRLAVGRIPTNNADKIKAYVEKIRKYEAGEATPVATIKNISYFADQDRAGYFEHFNQMSQNMMSVATGFTNSLYDRSILGSLNATKSKISFEFNAGPFMISLVGHGANDRFGDNIYNTTDVAALANNIYPIVATWNCETAYYYDSDKTMKTFGEELIYNPNGGAIAFLGSTTQTTPPAQAKLAQNFFSQLSSVTQKPWDGTRLGDILYQAKVGVGSGTYEKDIVNSFSIIGDPSLKLPASLFPSSPYVAPAAAPEAGSQKKGLFGCSAGASDGSDASPWHEGLIEWLLYMGVIVFGVKKVVRRPRIMS